ncbi:MAG TPA: hypothetical protein VE010_08395 [Thermoanaerobaculia bacterium]|nr:hypothetical protein [Thermoanaerobaculia bacterium]
MDAKEPQYVVCQNGVFILPENVFRALSSHVSNGFVYLRQDDDSLTISTSRIAEGRRRALNPRLRSPMFREATKLGIVDYSDSIRIMAVEWRYNATARVRRESPPAAP